MKYLGTIEVLDRVGCIFIKILIILFSYFPAVYSPFNLGLPRGNVIKCHPPEVLSYFKGYFTLVITQIVNNLRPKQKACVIATNDDVFLSFN